MTMVRVQHGSKLPHKRDARTRPHIASARREVARTVADSVSGHVVTVVKSGAVGRKTDMVGPTGQTGARTDHRTGKDRAGSLPLRKPKSRGVIAVIGRGR